MKTTDHLILGKRLCKNFFVDVTLMKRLLFISGNFLPDFFPHTYLRKYFSGERLRGHNYLNTREKIKKCFGKMQKLNKMSVFDFLRLGLLMHYVADAFTYAHNKWFEGTLKEHVEYEEKLHELFTAENNFLSFDFITQIEGSEKLFDFYDRIHEAYRKEIMEIKTDFRYINFITDFVVNKIVSACEEKASNVFAYVPLKNYDDDDLLAG